MNGIPEIQNPDSEIIKVLLIEDNPGDARLVREMLIEAGINKFNLEHVERINEGLNRLSQDNFQVILLELSLPDSHALETVDRVCHVAPYVPVLVLTGLDDETLAIRAVQKGAQDYLVKGQMDGNLLVRAIRYATERKRAEEVLRSEREKLEMVTENMGAGLALISKDYHTIWANNVLKQIFGDVEGKHCHSTYNQRAEICSECGVQEVFEKGTEKVAHEQVGKDIGGNTIWSEIISTPIKDKDGNITAALELVIPITERKRAEETLRESEERYRTLVETSPDAITLFDLNLNILMVNRPALTLYGYEKQEDVVGKSVLDYLVPEQFARARENIEKVLETGSMGTVEYTLRKKDGTLFSAEMRASLILDNQKKPNAILCVSRDITDRKRAEESLRTSEEKFRDLFDDAPVGYFEYDIQGRITRVNRTQLEMLGYTLTEMIDQPVWNFLVEVEQAREHIFGKLFGEIPPTQGSVRICRRKDGTTFPGLIQNRLLQDAEGKILGMRATVQDITERKQAEESLKQSEENARQLAEENAAMAEIGRIISSTLNIEEIYEAFSAEVRKIIPFDRIVINMIDTEKNTVRNVYISGKEVQDRNVKDVYPLEGSGNAVMVRTKSTLLIQTEDFNEYKDRFPMLLSTFQAGFRSIMNVPLFSKGEIIGGLLLRSRKPCAYTDKDVRLAERIGSQIAGAIANAQLYAERIQAEKEKTALEEQLRQSQKMEAIGRLAGGIAHDFNNLLTIINGYSQLSLIELKEGDPLKGNIEEVKKAANRAADLTRQLLAFSRRQVMEMRVLDLNILLKNLEKMLRRVIGEDIELVTLMAGDLGRVKTDSGQVEQVILNLAVNAKDAMPSGGKLTIETANVGLDETYVRRHVAVTPGRYVMLAVSDTGVGMTSEVRDRVFEPFFTTKEEGKGTGLGLSTVYGIVKQSEGSIWIYSEPGHGTTFKIYFPQVQELLEEVKEKVVGEELPRGSETVVVVEDQQEVRKLAARILKGQGYEVLEACNGADTLMICKERKEPFHLILTDVVMPQMSGRQLVEQLRQVYPNFKVLYMSGYTDNTIVNHGALERGVNYIQKPFTVGALTAKVREVLDNKDVSVKSPSVKGDSGGFYQG